MFKIGIGRYLLIGRGSGSGDAYVIDLLPMFFILFCLFFLSLYLVYFVEGNPFDYILDPSPKKVRALRNRGLMIMYDLYDLECEEYNSFLQAKNIPSMVKIEMVFEHVEALEKLMKITEEPIDITNYAGIKREIINAEKLCFKMVAKISALKDDKLINSKK